MEELGIIAFKYFQKFMYVLKSIFSRHGNLKCIRNLTRVFKKSPSHTKFDVFFNPLAKNIIYVNSFFKIMLQSVIVFTYLRACKLPKCFFDTAALTFSGEP